MGIKKYAEKILRSFGIILICVPAFFVFMAYAAEENASAPEAEEISNIHELDVITIDNQAYDKDRKGPATFPHLNHAKDYGISCWECHHDYADEENTWSPWNGTMKCIECHDPAEDNGEIIKLQTAYHLNCKTCHKEKKVFGNDAQAYRKCTTCHEKK